MRSKKVLILILMLTLIILVLFTFVSIINIREKKNNENNISNELEVISNKKILTIEDVIKKYDSIFLEEKNYIIYVEFNKDLYDEDGKSNEEYFEDIIKDLSKVNRLREKTFFIKDEKKLINIFAEYNFQFKKHIITYNNTEDFFKNPNSKNYAKVDKVDIIEKVSLGTESTELDKLIDEGLFFKSIKDSIGEGIKLDNGYYSYNDGSILIKREGSRVTSIIFTEKYEKEVFSGIKVGTDLKEVEKKIEYSYKGSAKEGYLMCRTKDVYVFFYKDQIVVYGYFYYRDLDFEKVLENYLENGNLQTFVEFVIRKWGKYDICEYDFEAQSAHITYPSRGIEINIENNNSLGIIFYNNYYISDKIKEFIKAGKVSLNDKVDYLEYAEKNRRKNSEE